MFRIEVEMDVLRERDLVLAQREGEQRVRDLSIAKQQKDIEDAKTKAKQRQLELERENAQIREKLLKELFGTDAIGRAKEGPDVRVLRSALLGAGDPLQGVGKVAFPGSDVASPVERVRLEVTGLLSELVKVPSIAQTAFGVLAGVAGSAFDALVIGGDASIKNLKKLFGEPIVAHLRAKAIEEFVLGSTELVRLNLPKAGGHFRNAALATAGAGLVARIAGVGAPGGGVGSGGGGGTSVNQRSDGTGLGAQLGAGQTQLVRMEIVVMQQTPDGRTVARTTQHIQRLRDLDQPLRVVL
jgi:hypothetical protein